MRSAKYRGCQVTKLNWIENNEDETKNAKDDFYIIKNDPWLKYKHKKVNLILYKLPEWKRGRGCVYWKTIVNNQRDGEHPLCKSFRIIFIPHQNNNKRIHSHNVRKRDYLGVCVCVLINIKWNTLFTFEDNSAAPHPQFNRNEHLKLSSSQYQQSQQKHRNKKPIPLPSALPSRAASFTG